MSKETGIKLNTYLLLLCSYLQKDDVLKRHKDRYSCEVSMTMNLGGTHKSDIFRSV